MGILKKMKKSFLEKIHFCPYTLITIISIILHLFIVYSIISQPLNVNSQQNVNKRSIIWTLYNDTVHRIGPGADFFSIYHAGIMMKRGFTPYERNEEPSVTPYFFDFRYLPIVGSTLGKFFIQFSPSVAYKLWVILLEIILGTLIVVISKRIINRPLRCFFCCILLLNSPYFLEVHMGQFTFVTIALFTIGVVIQEYPKDWFIGLRAKLLNLFTFTISIILKVVTIITGAVLIRFRRYWLSLLFATVVLILTSVPYIPDDMNIFINLNFSHPIGGLDVGNFSMPYFIYLFAKDHQFMWILNGWNQFLSIWRIVILGLTALLVVLTKNRKVGILSSSLLLAHFISYIHVWEHHMSGVIVIGTLLLFEIFNETIDKRNSLIIILILFALVLLAIPTPFTIFDTVKDTIVWDASINWSPYQRYFLILSKIGPVFLLYIISILIMIKSGLGSIRKIVIES